MSDFQKVKAVLNIKDVITRETGLQVKKKFLQECPFCHGHDCFTINEGKQVFKCFQCPDKRGGDIFTFGKALLNISDQEVLKRYAEWAGIDIRPSQAQAVKLSVCDKIMIDAATYYHENMLSNGASAYLTEKRGHKMDTLKKLCVGFSDGKLIDVLRHKKYSDQDMIKTGLVVTKEIKGESLPRMLDFFGRGFYIYPHFSGSRVTHITMKDPAKKMSYQLPAAKRHKSWFFYNQDVLNHGDEIILVEGENDLQSVVDSGYHNVIAQIGQTSEDQIKALGARCRKKRLILWLDNDEVNEKTGKRAGHGYIRKICSSLRDIDIRIILYPDNCDPDEYLRGFKGDRRQEIKRLIDEAPDYITWEIHQAGKEADLEKKLNALKEYSVFKMIALLPQIKQQVYAEKLVSIGFTQQAVAEQIEDKLDTRRRLNIYFETLADKSKADPNIVADIIYKAFSKEGRFFYDKENNVFLLYGNQVYEINNNRPFNALIKKHTMLLPTKEPGRSVWESLASEGYNTGSQINVSSWIHTDRVTDTIFLNLNSANNIIFKVNKKGIEEVPNGLNENEVLLRSSDNIKPFTYLPDADIREGFKALKTLVFDTFTCEKEQRWLIICWIISAFMLDFVKAQPLMKFAGGSSSGKSTCGGRVSLLLYGEDLVGDPSAAAAYSEASRNPLVIIDNLESGDFNNAILKFLLLAATGGQKTKRTSGTESGVTKEKPKALILITAIEPFLKAELINRTIEIEFSTKYQMDGFSEDDITGKILKSRDLILSSILKLVSSQILPQLKDRRSYISVLQKEYRSHAKSRMNEYLALLMIILDKVLPYIPYFEKDDVMAGMETGAPEIRKAWIEYQDSRAKETEVMSNDILKLLDGLVREYVMKMKELDLKPEEVYGYDKPVFYYQHPEYGLSLIKTNETTVKDGEDGYMKSVIEIEATSKDFVHAFDRFCKNNGLKNPYTTGAVFGSRLKNDMSLLKKGGWDLITREGIEPYYKIIHGARFYKLSHVYIR